MSHRWTQKNADDGKAKVGSRKSDLNKKLMNRLILLITITLTVACAGSKSTAKKTFDEVTVGNERLQLRNDTLYSSTGTNYYIGQELIIGQPAGVDGYYRSITSRHAAIVPSIWGQDKRFEYAIENHVSGNKSREIVKQQFKPGKTVTIKSIRLWENSKPNFYLVWLSYANEAYACDIQFAVALKELLLL